MSSKWYRTAMRDQAAINQLAAVIIIEKLSKQNILLSESEGRLIREHKVTINVRYFYS